MSWCCKCHYGSDTCQLIPAGDGLKKCPMCGEVSDSHLDSRPFGVKQTAAQPTRNKTKKRNSREHEEDFFDKADPLTQGLKALDYSKGQ